MTYGCLVWSLTTIKNMDCISILQKKCLRILNFAPINSHTNSLFLLDKVIKFTDVIKIEQLKLVFQFKHKLLPMDILNLFELNSAVSSQVKETFLMKVYLFLEFILLVLVTSLLGFLLLCHGTILLKEILNLTLSKKW